MPQNSAEIGNRRERAFLVLIGMSQRSPDVAAVRDPDYHLDAPFGQKKVGRLKFDFCWEKERVLVELDGGQYLKGGGRHGGDGDRWKTNEAMAAGWRVLHYSPEQMKKNPARMLDQIARVLALQIADKGEHG
jgi:hypothetical protein